MDAKRKTMMTTTAALCTLAASVLVYQIQIPNPVILLVSLMIFFTAAFSRLAGAVSAMVIAFYAIFFFSTGHGFLHFTSEAAYKCTVVVLSLFIIHIMVSKLKQHANEAYQQVLRVNQELESASDHDALTGIYNRRGGDKALARYIEGNGNQQKRLVHPFQRKKEHKAVLAAIDVDNFKHFNDVYGHAVGDEVLRYLVREMQATFPADSEFIRHGGDEFMLLLQDADRAAMIRLLRQFATRTFEFTCHGERLSFCISCGYALYTEQASTVAELCSQADTALYYVKMNGKNHAAMFDEAMDKNMRTQLGFSLLNIFEGLPVAIIIYRADPTEEILLATQSAIELFGCKTLHEFMQYTGGCFHNLVHPDDVKDVKKSILAQIAKNPSLVDSVEYRIRTKDGKIRYIHDLGRMVQDPQLGAIFYVVLYDKDDFAIKFGEH